jgi:hypothetical protein
MKAEEIIEENVCLVAVSSSGLLVLTRTVVSLHRLEDLARHLRREERCTDRERDELDERRLRFRFDFLECFFRGVGDREEQSLEIDRERFR